MSWEQHIASRLKLRELHILMEVVKSGSMGKAADRLHVTQPVVSKAIANLEHALGARLLDRNMRGVTLTDYGQAALKCGTAVFDELNKGLAEIQFIADPSVGTVRIGCSDPEFIGLVADVVERLSSRYPRIAFHILRVEADAPYRELIARQVDVVITTLLQGRNHDSIATELLFKEPIVIAVGSQSRWARRRRVDLAELVDEPWILPSPESFAALAVTDAFRSLGLPEPKPVVVCASEKRVALLAGGRFVTAIPFVILQSAGRRLPIKALPLILRTQQRPIGMVTLKGRSVSPAEELFINSLRNAARLVIKTSQSGRNARGGNKIRRSSATVPDS